MIAPTIRSATCEYVPGVEFRVCVSLTADQKARLHLAADYAPPALIELINQWSAAQSGYNAAIAANPDLVRQQTAIQTLEKTADEDPANLADLMDARAAFAKALAEDEVVAAAQAALTASDAAYTALKSQILDDYYALLARVFGNQSYPYGDDLALDFTTGEAAKATLVHPEIDDLTKYWLCHVPMAMVEAEVANISQHLKALSRGTISLSRAASPKTPPST